MSTEYDEQPVCALARPVAAFDFDGTLTRSDTLVPFLRRVAGDWRCARGLAAAVVAGRRRGEAGRDLAKRQLLASTLGGVPDARLRVAGEEYAAALLAGAMRDEVVDLLDAHRDRGDRVVVVSASLEHYLAPVCRELGVDDLICCRLGVDPSGRCTGRLLGVNPRGQAKADLLRQLLGEDVTIGFAYGNDPAADGAMLGLATVARVIGGRSQ